MDRAHTLTSTQYSLNLPNVFWLSITSSEAIKMELDDEGMVGLKSIQYSAQSKICMDNHIHYTFIP